MHGMENAVEGLVQGSQEPFVLRSEDRTSQSLLVRVGVNDQGSWRQLVTLYSPLVAHWCRQAGLPETERDDVIQEVFAAVSAGLKDHKKGHPAASFRAWMRGIARHKIQDHFRRATGLAEGGTEALLRLHEVPQPVDPLDLSEGEAETTGLYRRALGLIRAHFEERTWQAFWKVVIDNDSPVDVAVELGMSPTSVRQAKSRVLRRLKVELGEAIA
jgi:RNA polymerase sigma-70 factor (ECF subfamily)